ncbi:Gfo/Idh/MocA family oxidoreductase [Micrococcales bacterium 31B]|nr:Gfo/Idh/MocA family oxidoreductase [Micrococcales bacterium 31B]
MTETFAPVGSGPVGVGLIGAGNISQQYLNSLTQFPDLKVLFIADIDAERAAEAAAKYGVPGSGSTEELLAVDDIEIVINLTIPAVHVEVSQQILNAGKHVFSEKPMSLDQESGRALLQTAADTGLRVGCAPDTFLGQGHQISRRLLENGEIGRPLTALCLMQNPGPEAWHPSPEFFFLNGAGPLFDMGPYYLTQLVQVFGPVARVAAVTNTAFETRTVGSGPKEGTEFPVEVPTHVGGLLQFESGASAQLIMSFESRLVRMGFTEVTGTEGTMALPDPNMFIGDITVTRGHEDSTVLPGGSQESETFAERGQGVLDMARAIRAGRPHRVTGELAFHVVDVMCSLIESGTTGAFVDIASTAVRPEPLPEDYNPKAATL